VDDALLGLCHNHQARFAKGLNDLRLERVVIQKHRHGKGEERRLYSDHFPVVAILRFER
jgi:predicted GNAT superfamily acetyltransferase